MEEYIKAFHVVKFGGNYKIILESFNDNDDVFQDIIKLVDKYSAEILKIVVNNSFKNNLETEFHLFVKNNKLDELLGFIKGLGYNELG